jgi:hypothetical protein
MFARIDLSAIALTKKFGIPSDIAETLTETVVEVIQVGFSRNSSSKTFKILNNGFSIQESVGIVIKPKQSDFGLQLLPWR